MSVETKRDAFKKIIDIRKFAVNTLEKFQKGHEGVTQKEFIDEVLYTYGIGDLEEAGPPERFN